MKRFSNYAKLLPALAALVSTLLSGCATVHRANSEYDTTFGKKRETSNVYRTGDMPSKLTRVAILPLFKGDYDHMDLSLIEENFRLELTKLNLFEVVAIEPDTMRELFAQERFSSIEVLPTQLIDKLYARYAIDGLLLMDLSYFKAYQPVGIGMRAKLVNCETGNLMWAVDEVFDSSNPAVSNAARKYYKTESILSYPLQNTQSTLHSPGRFSKYVAHSLFGAMNLQKS
ncbi:MAG: hypothetical protein CBD18_06365 [Opitutales bacterium TMED158]|nr:MAG: hypothetical protein CBD18_06365 [Opitutales bacterium TMED158]